MKQGVVVALVVLGLLAAVSNVWACKGKKVLYEDNFQTLDPAWGGPWSNRNVKNGKLIVHPDVNKARWDLNEANVFEDMDACVKVRLEKSDDPDQPGGLIFWGKDVGNFYALLVAANGRFQVRRLVSYRWLSPVPWRDEAAVKKSMGEVNHLRVVTKGNQATVYINDKEVTTFKGQPPEGGGLIGVYSESSEKTEAVWEFSDLKITQ